MATSKLVKYSWSSSNIYSLTISLYTQPSRQGLACLLEVLSWDNFELCLGNLWKNTSWSKLTILNYYLIC